MGTLSFLRRHSTLAVFTASLGASACVIACDDDEPGPIPEEAGAGGSTGGTGGAGTGGSAGKATGGSAGKGGTGGGAAGGSAGKGGTGGGAAGAGGSNVPDAQPDVITSNGDAATDGDVPDGN